MNSQFFGERAIPEYVLENPEQAPTNPVINSNPSASTVPMESAQINESLFGGTLAPIVPIDSTMSVPAEAALVAGHPQQIPTPVAEGALPATERTYEAPLSKTVPYTAPVGEKVSGDGSTSLKPESPVALLSREETEHFHTRWNEIQGKFVDEPRTAVQQADKLVSEVIEHFTQMFASEHSSLESQWNQGSDVSTEDLRKALQHYRSFFNRLVV